MDHRRKKVGKQGRSPTPADILVKILISNPAYTQDQDWIRN